MKILFIGHEKDVNGASKSLLNIISQFEEKNKIYVLTSFGEGEFVNELKQHKVKILVEKFYLWKNGKEKRVIGENLKLNGFYIKK